MADADHQHCLQVKSASNTDCEIESDFQTISLESENPSVHAQQDKAIETTFESPHEEASNRIPRRSETRSRGQM